MDSNDELEDQEKEKKKLERETKWKRKSNFLKDNNKLCETVSELQQESQ